MQHADGIKYCKSVGWLVWTGTHWQRNADLEAERLAKDTALSILTEARHEKNDDQRKRLLSHAKYSESQQGIMGMLRVAHSEENISANGEALDADPMLLNVQNGTLDLDAGKLRTHRPADLITRVCPVKYDSDAKAPRWEQFLDEIMGGDKELVVFLQRVLGYALTGDTREQCFFFLYGPGAKR